MTREEALKSLAAVQERLKYSRVAQVVELKPAACGEMYNHLEKVESYLTQPPQPAAAPATRAITESVKALCLSTNAAQQAEDCDLRFTQDDVIVGRTELMLLCDALLAMTVQS